MLQNELDIENWVFNVGCVARYCQNTRERLLGNDTDYVQYSTSDHDSLDLPVSGGMGR